MKFSAGSRNSDRSVSRSDLDLMKEEDRRKAYLTAILMVSCFLAVFVFNLATDFTVYGLLPIIAVPFFVLGFINYVLNKRWFAAIFVAVATLVCYLIEPVLALFMLYIFVCAEGVATTVELIQRLIFYRILVIVERVNIVGKPSVWDRVVVFLFNIPCDLDTRNLTMDSTVRRKGLPWRDMSETMVIALVLSVFLWIYMFLNPAFYTGTSGISIYTFTIVLYIAVLVMPWSIFSALDVRIGTEYRDFKLYKGLLETMKRMFLPSMAALIFLALAVSDGGQTLYYILMSIVMIVVIIAFTSVMYYTHNEASVVNDIEGKWKVFHPADIYSDFGGRDHPAGMDDMFPGTPMRDPRSCFDRTGDQKY